MYAIDKLACPIAVHSRALYGLLCQICNTIIFYFPIAKHIEELFALLYTYFYSFPNHTLGFS